MPRSVPFECPVCGAEVAPKARACPGCGADERTGWNEEMTLYDGMDLPDAAFDEPGEKKPLLHQRKRTKVFLLVAVVLAAVFTLIALGLH